MKLQNKTKAALLEIIDDMQEHIDYLTNQLKHPHDLDQVDRIRVTSKKCHSFTIFIDTGSGNIKFSFNHSICILPSAANSFSILNLD